MVRIFVHSLQNFGKRTSEHSERMSFSSEVLQRMNMGLCNHYQEGGGGGGGMESEVSTKQLEVYFTLPSFVQTLK